MKTEYLQNNADDILRAGEILANGGLVGIPTETVYGLAANAFDAEAVGKIFVAKGRPQDNPLIVHIASPEDLEPLVGEVSESVKRLAAAFWPGPLTMIVPKPREIPDAVSAGLSTIGVRCPSHETARAIIRASGVPLAAPSANRSGRPSPTSFHHVREDLDGRVDAILDGGVCQVGVESTVVDMTGEVPVLLRPGGVTLRDLRSVLGEVEVDEAVTGELTPGRRVRAPGMKYRHYAPKAPVTILDGTIEKVAEYLKQQHNAAVLCFTEEAEALKGCCDHVETYGGESDTETMAQSLFAALRKFDELAVEQIFARAPSAGDGIELAVINRLEKAAGFSRMTVEGE
ncbi:MAG: threonylcarbamoyl-AMP synthase [Ruminococcaceae bacterium]|nr:threonylcarbamoyl-AMP synthase [Oscillospiraceae bacterium]